MAEAGISGFGKTVRSLCSLRAKSRLLYAHDKVYGCVSSQRRHSSARYILQRKGLPTVRLARSNVNILNIAISGAILRVNNQLSENVLGTPTANNVGGFMNISIIQYIYSNINTDILLGILKKKLYYLRSYSTFWLQKKGLFCLMELSPFLVTGLFVGCTATECRGTWHNVY